MYTTNFAYILLLVFAACSKVFAYPHDMMIGPRATITGGNSDIIQGTAAPSSMQTTTGPKPTGSASGTGSKSATGSGGSTASKTNKVSTTVIDPALGPGQIVIQTPAPTETLQYYKIGDYVTFGWNYTNLLVQPTLKVQAYCSQNNQYYDIASNLSVSQTSVVWNTSTEGGVQSRPFIEAFYNLVIFDQGNPAQVSATASAGELAVFRTLKFGMYSKTSYTPLASYQCATCDNSTATNLNMRAVRFTLGLGLISAFSFIYVVNGVM